MASARNSQTDTDRAQAWLRPEEVEDLREAALTTGADYLQDRNDMLIATLYHLGLRVGELVQLDVEDFDLEARELYLPSAKQKDYPSEDDEFPRFKGSNFGGDEPGFKPQIGGIGLTFQVESGKEFRLQTLREQSTAPYIVSQWRSETISDAGSYNPTAIVHRVPDNTGGDEDGRMTFEIRNNGTNDLIEDWDASQSPLRKTTKVPWKFHERQSGGDTLLHRWIDESDTALWQIQIPSGDDEWQFLDGSDLSGPRPMRVAQGEAPRYERGNAYPERGAPSTSELQQGERLVYTSDGSDSHSQGDLVSARNDGGTMGYRLLNGVFTSSQDSVDSSASTTTTA